MRNGSAVPNPQGCTTAVTHGGAVQQSACIGNVQQTLCATVTATRTPSLAQFPTTSHLPTATSGSRRYGDGIPIAWVPHTGTHDYVPGTSESNPWTGGYGQGRDTPRSIFWLREYFCQTRINLSRIYVLSFKVFHSQQPMREDLNMPGPSHQRMPQMHTQIQPQPSTSWDTGEPHIMPNDYSYAYYEPGPPTRHTNVPSRHPITSKQILLRLLNVVKLISKGDDSPK